MEDEQLAELGKHIATQLAENEEFVAAIARAIMDAPVYPLDEDIEWPCYGCEAIGNDEQCYNKRHTVNNEGVEGLGCPRIQRIIDEQSSS